MNISVQYKLCRAYVPDAALLALGKIYKVSTIYGHDGHLGLVTWTMYTNFPPPSQEGSTLNLALICQAVSEEKMIEHCGQG